MPPIQSLQTPEKRKNEPVGPTVGIVIIVLLLFVGALYFLGKELTRQSKTPPPYIPGDAAVQQ